jgi:hypothetical protein
VRLTVRAKLIASANIAVLRFSMLVSQTAYITHGTNRIWKTNEETVETMWIA